MSRSASLPTATTAEFSDKALNKFYPVAAFRRRFFFEDIPTRTRHDDRKRCNSCGCALLSARVGSTYCRSSARGGELKDRPQPAREKSITSPELSPRTIGDLHRGMTAALPSLLYLRCILSFFRYPARRSLHCKRSISSRAVQILNAEARDPCLHRACPQRAARYSLLATLAAAEGRAKISAVKTSCFSAE